MAIQVVRARERQPSTEDQFIEAFMQSSSNIGEALAGRRNREIEDEALKREYGVDFSGIRDPKQRQMLAEKASLSKSNELKGKSQQRQQDIVAKALRNEELTSEEKASLPVNVQLALDKKRNPKETKKTQASQPIDEDQLRRIDEVRKNPNFEKASPSKKYQMFTDAGVSKENAKAEADIYSDEEKTSIERKKEKNRRKEKLSDQEFAEKIRVHKESEEFDKQVLERSRIAKKTLGSVKEAEKILSKGNVKPSSAVNILSMFGDVGKTLATAIQNQDQAAIKALMPEFLEGKKEVFGVRLSDADLKLLQDKSIDIGKSPEANKAILGLIKKYADQSVLRGSIASEISKKTGGYRPLGYERMVDEEFDRQVSPVMMIDPKTGMYLSVPAYRVSSAISKGAKILKEEEDE